MHPPDAQGFLELLWGTGPWPGYAQIWTLADRESTYLKDPAAARNFAGKPDVFTAVGMTATRLGARQRAKANQIAAITGCFLDLDIGTAPGNLPNRTCALSFANKHLRPTITIDSGNGVHAWYLFPRPWIFPQAQRADAASLIRRFVTLHQRSAAQRGWHLDSVGDLARILRLPDTLNAKDPANPRPVEIIEWQGPRHTIEALQALVADVPDLQTPAADAIARAPVNLTGDTSEFDGKLDALLENSPEFAAVWNHERIVTDNSASAYDLSLCTLAAGAMTDPELAVLLYTHRKRWGYDLNKLNRRANGTDHYYVNRTIGLARDKSTRDQHLRDLDQMGRAA
jgi:hypothetical protein